MKRKVCKKCKAFAKGTECPLCKSKDLITTWKGRIIVEDIQNSEIAKKMGIEVKGEYTIKTR